MAIFVGAEYIIANALIALQRKGIDKIHVSTLQTFGIMVQKLCIEKSVDAVVLLSKQYVNAAIYNFSDYFSYTEDSQGAYIHLKSGAEIQDMESRFIGYLPLDVLMIITEAANELVAA